MIGNPNDNHIMTFKTDATLVESKDGEVRYKKLEDNTKNVHKEENEVLFCVTVDGSTHSEISFDIVRNEFLKSNGKLLLVHIYNDKLDNAYNYKNKKDTVIKTYANKIYNIEKSNFIIQNRKDESIHALQQINILATNFKSNYLVAGYYGIKGAKGENTELSRGVNFLLGTSAVPIIIVKDTLVRKDTKTKGYSWLVVLENSNRLSFNCFLSFIKLIDSEKDFVFGMNLIDNSNGSSKDNFKDSFMEEIEKYNIKNFEYELSYYSRVSSTVIIEKVNYGETHFDFVVFFNNRSKHINDGKNSDVINIVKDCKSSICVYNF